MFLHGLLYCFWDRMSLCGSNWARTHGNSGSLFQVLVTGMIQHVQNKLNMFGWVCISACDVCMCSHVPIYVGMSKKPEVDVGMSFSIISLPYFLRQWLSLNLSCADLGSLAVQKAYGICLPLPSSACIIDTRPHTCFLCRYW